jgi:ABC-type amino acid transport substrate-binding protein
MRTFLIIAISVLISVLITSLYMGKQTQTTSASSETAYERVTRTGVLRCGYAAWPMFLDKDTKTGKVSGMLPEIIETVAAHLQWEVEWVEEVGWDGFIQALKNGRIDMFCMAAWSSAERGKHVRFSSPIAYSAVNAYARAGDTRFDQDLFLLNDPAMRLAVIDGEMSSLIAQMHFPKAKQVALAGMIADPAQLLQNVALGKADAAFAETSLAKGYAEHNPDKIRLVTKTPFAVFASSFPVALEEEKLMTVFDAALVEMLNNGEIDRIISKHEPDRTIFLPVAKPYAYLPPNALP